MRVRRLPRNPIVHPGLHPSLGDNINGPSLLRVPDWVEGALGRYHLYFADHRGRWIRLAVADDPAGPWRIHPPGALGLEASGFPVRSEELLAPSEPLRRLVQAGLLVPHIASPDVVTDPERRELRMYFHGMCRDLTQQTRVAVSRDGVHFAVRGGIQVPLSYLRVFRHDGAWMGLAMPGVLFRSLDGLSEWEQGPQLFPDGMRHAALLPRGSELLVFWTRVGDRPERILCSRIDLRPPWRDWKASREEEVLAPEEPWEGAALPLEASRRGFAPGPVHALRDPYVFQEGDRSWLLYAVAGESGLAIAELEPV